MKKTPTKKLKRETTIDDLAVMVANGFNEMRGEMNTRFNEINDKFKEVDRRFDRLESVVFKIDTKLNDVDKRLKKVEEAVETLLLGYSIARGEIKELNARIFRLEKKAGLAK